PRCGRKQRRFSTWYDYSPPLSPAHHRRLQLLDRGRADLLHHGVGFRAQQLEHALDAALAEGAKTPDIGPPDAYGLRADAQRFDDIGAAPEAAVDDDRDAPVHRLDDFRQRVDGRAAGVLAAGAVVRDDDGIDAVIGGDYRVFPGEDALNDDLHLGGVAQPLEEIPGHGRRLGIG